MTPHGFHIAELAVPTDPTLPGGPVWDGTVECSIAYNLDLYGNDDLADIEIDANRTRYTKQRERRKIWLVALAGERPDGTPDGRIPGIRLLDDAPGADTPPATDVLAVTFVGAPLLDNLHLLETNPAQVRPSAAGLGIDEAMLATYDTIARTWDRTTLLAWAGHPHAAAGPDDPAVADPRGEIRLRRDDPTVARYLAAGYAFAQAERHSIQPIPVPADVREPACDDTRARAAGYEVLQWTGLSPAEHLDDLARLNESMATDPPLGDVDWRPEIWDADRVREGEERGSLDGTLVSTVVRHVESGQLVGFTQLIASHARPQVAYQWATLVNEHHRGHGLGMLLKAANSRLLHEAFPEVVRVHTWNADENDYMLRVNIALGYAAAGIEGCWQKVLS